MATARTTAAGAVDTQSAIKPPSATKTNISSAPTQTRGKSLTDLLGVTKPASTSTLLQPAATKQKSNIVTPTGPAQTIAPKKIDVAGAKSEYMPGGTRINSGPTVTGTVSNPATGEIKNYPNATRLNSGTVVASGTVYDPQKNTITTYGTPEAVQQSSQEAVQPAASPEIQSGLSGVRQTLISRGISNDRIGWNQETQNITIDGVDVGTPQQIVNGTSYADQPLLNRITDKAYKQAGNELVGARDFAANYGLNAVPEWDPASGKLQLGSYQLDPVYVSDGIAYVKKSDMESLVGKIMDDGGYTSNQNILEDFYNKYGDDIDNTLRQILDRGEFAYNAESDPIYKQYEEQYTRNAEEAMREILNKNNTSLEGANGAVMGQVISAYYDAMKELSDKVPELAQQAYDRYTGETSRLSGNLSALDTVANDYYDRAYTANQDSRDYANAARTEERAWQDQHALNDATIRATDADIRNATVETDANARMASAEAAAQEFANQTTVTSTVGAWTPMDVEKIPQLQYLVDKGVYHYNDDGFLVDRSGALVKPWGQEMVYENDMQGIANAAKNGGASISSMLNQAPAITNPLEAISPEEAQNAINEMIGGTANTQVTPSAAQLIAQGIQAGTALTPADIVTIMAQYKQDPTQQITPGIYSKIPQYNTIPSK